MEASLQATPETMRSLFHQRQRELEQMHESHVAALEQKLLSGEAELASLQQEHSALLGDFRFNLTLIAERDDELVQFERACEDLRDRLYASEGRLSEAAVAIASVEDARASDRAAANDRAAALERRIREARLDAEASKRAADEEARRERERAESARREYALALHNQGEAMRRELAEAAAAFDTKVLRMKMF